MRDVKGEMMALLNRIAEFGKDPGGGVTRHVFTKEWTQAQHELKRVMEADGLHTFFDETGNLYGRLEGSALSAETVMTGSHVDTVRNGGQYDGQFGIVAGIMALRLLREQYGQPLRSVEIVSVADEEGARFDSNYWGSFNIIGAVSEREVRNLKDRDGVGFVEAMRSCGFNFKTAPTRSDIKCFIETHIEQGGVLEREGKDVGVVTAIVGLSLLSVTVAGNQNHAGTTPMDYRADALASASKMIRLVFERALAKGRPLVATVGKVNVVPNTTNVIPGKVNFTIDIRHTEDGAVEAFIDEVKREMLNIAEADGTQVAFELLWAKKPTPLSPQIVGVIQRVCDEGGFNYKVMHSGAGHDAQVTSAYIPTGMIFVPSHKGVSHSPDEFTAPEYLEKGVLVLAQTLYKLAYQ